MPYRPPEYIRLMAAAVDAKASYFPAHSDGVAYILRMMCAQGDFDPVHTQKIMTAAILHDLGKLRVHDAVLNAPRKLTEAEWILIRQHPVFSSLIASATEGCEYAAPWVRHHHEHFDGSGYPDGLAGMDIPFESRMILVADAFQVMTVDRPYRAAVSRLTALNEIERLAGVQFCPIAVPLLVGAMEDGDLDSVHKSASS